MVESPLRCSHMAPLGAKFQKQFGGMPTVTNAGACFAYILPKSRPVKIPG